MSAPFVIVLVTAPNLDCARQLARGAVEQRLAACGSLLPGVESIYWWEGKVEQAAEVQILFKTTAAAVARLEAHIRENHPYDTPEFLVLPVEQGNDRYLRWLRESVGDPLNGEGTAGAAQSRP